MEILWLSLAALLLAGCGTCYLHCGSVTPEEGERVKLNTLFSRRTLWTVGILGAVLGACAVIWACRYYGNGLLHGLRLLFLLEWLLVIALIDLKCYVIQNRVLLAGLLAAVLLLAVQWLLGASLTVLLRDSLLGLLLGLAVFGLCALLSRGGMGAGDVKLFALLGLLLGWQGCFNVILFSVLGMALCGIVLMLLKRKNRRSLLPMGPFALFGMVVSLLLGI